MCVTVTRRSGLNDLSPYTRKLAFTRNKDLVSPGGDRRPQAVSTRATGSRASSNNNEGNVTREIVEVPYCVNYNALLATLLYRPSSTSPPR